MEAWPVHRLYDEAKEKLGIEQARALRIYATSLIDAEYPVIFTLGHLAKITGVSLYFLQATVRRKREAANYRLFNIRKRSGGRRYIHAVTGKLLRVQTFINREVLRRSSVHPCSYAFHKNGGIRECAAKHCRARWLLQFDLADYFFSIPEHRVYEVFRNCGYRNLLAFELARICTTTHLPRSIPPVLSTSTVHDGDLENLPYWPRLEMGVLPQGAPTSPMLSNLVAYQLDQRLLHYAREFGLVYTRYADDITLSTSELPQAKSISSIRREIIAIIRDTGFRENPQKIRIAGPGARKVVLGLLVDGNRPRLSRKMYKRIESRLYAAGKYGIPAASQHYGFESAFGFYNHLCGLVSFVNDVDPERCSVFKGQLSRIQSPI